MIELHASPGSLIRSWGWQGDREEAGVGMFVVEFRDGSIWAYQAVPDSVLADFLMAESRGRFYRERIGGKFSGAPVTEGVDWRFRRA